MPLSYDKVIIRFKKINRGNFGQNAILEEESAVFSQFVL